MTRKLLAGLGAVIYCVVLALVHHDTPCSKYIVSDTPITCRSAP